MTSVDVLFFDGCPNHEPLLARLPALIAASRSDASVTLVEVVSDADALERRFLGSPTVRVNGEDVEPGAADRTDFGLTCRLYPTDQGMRGSIPDAMITRALVAARPVDPDLSTSQPPTKGSTS